MTETKLQLTSNQQLALEKIRAFVESKDQVFILGGYAGTGKTTLLHQLTEQLRAQGRQVALMAPTGRATKVLREKTGLDAATIHSSIYDYHDLKEVKVADEDGADSFRYYFELKNSDSIRHRIFIVDESSMVSDDFSEGEFFRFGSGKLLSDLIGFTRVQHPLSNNKLIFVGDPAQLPPPTSSKVSPALSSAYLLEKFGLTTDTALLSEVVRQAGDSGILSAAGQIRRGLGSGFFNRFRITPNHRDVHHVAQEHFYQLYDTAPGNKIIIAYTNQTAHQLNLDIRRHKHGGEYPVRAGDVMLVGQNNHLTGLFNGEFGVINKCEDIPVSRELSFRVIGGKTERVLLKWRKIELAYKDEHGFKTTRESYMLENFLYGNGNTLRPEEQQALYVDFKNRHKDLSPGSQTFKETLRQDPFFNALRLKYGYAVTCHKAQGGEWANAFVFWDYARSISFNVWTGHQDKKGRDNADFFRWAYTAITRASGSLYCINPPVFTPYDQMMITNTVAIPGMQHLQGETPNICTFEVTPPMLNTLERLGVPGQPEALRGHALSILHQCQLANIELTGWKQSEYEFIYTFRQQDKSASIKGWIKGNGAFSPTYQKNPGATNSDELFNTVHQMCKEHARFQPEFPQSQNGTFPKAAPDWSSAKEKPFLEQLYTDIQPDLAAHHIIVSQISHLDYRDRYTFERQGEKVILDAIYDGQGFFSQVMPLLNPTPAPRLLRDLETIFNELKKR